MSNHPKDASADRRLTTPELLRNAAARYAAARSSVLQEWQESCCREPEEYPECARCLNLATFKKLIREQIRFL